MTAMSATGTVRPSPGDRVRRADARGSDALRAGTGEVTAMTDETVTVRWDGGGYPFSTAETAEELVVVPIRCSYEQVQWKRGQRWGITGMIVVCDVHGAPAASEVYDVAPGEEGTVTARCQGPWT